MEKELLKYIQDKYQLTPKKYEYEFSEEKNSNIHQVGIIGFLHKDKYVMAMCTILYDALEPVLNSLAFGGIETMDLKDYIKSYRKINENRKG